jgi:hypothetical protein
MRRYSEGERTNNPEMMNMMMALSPSEREAMGDGALHIGPLIRQPRDCADSLNTIE